MPHDSASSHLLCFTVISFSLFAWVTIVSFTSHFHIDVGRYEVMPKLVLFFIFIMRDDRLVRLSLWSNVIVRNYLIHDISCDCHVHNINVKLSLIDAYDIYFLYILYSFILLDVYTRYNIPRIIEALDIPKTQYNYSWLFLIKRNLQ